MKASDIITQLQVVLPTLTDDFSTQIALTSVIPAGTTATATTATAHGFIIGNVVNISDTVAPVAITSISRSGTVATAVTTTNHDITENDLTVNVTLSGATESEFNGTFPLLSANNRKEFKFTVPDAGPTSATGSPILEDPPSAFGFNGLQTITAVPTTTTFEYTLPVTLTEAAVGSGKVHSGIQITGAVSVDRAEDMYTKQTGDSLWAFVILGDVVASKDRNSRSDAVASMGRTGSRRQQIFTSFSVLVAKRATSDLSARDARDDMEDVRTQLFRALLGWEAPSGLTGQSGYGVIYVGDGFGAYDTAVYWHQFEFQLVADISQDDTIDPDFNVAFRDISLTMTTTLGTEQMTAAIDLDDEPLP